jgi:hypothetical protein
MRGAILYPTRVDDPAGRAADMIRPAAYAHAA